MLAPSPAKDRTPIQTPPYKAPRYHGPKMPLTGLYALPLPLEMPLDSTLCPVIPHTPMLSTSLSCSKLIRPHHLLHAPLSLPCPLTASLNSLYLAQTHSYHIPTLLTLHHPPSQPTEFFLIRLSTEPSWQLLTPS